MVAKGRTDGRRKQASGEIKVKDASGGSFAYTTKETTEDEGRQQDRFGQQVSARSTLARALWRSENWIATSPFREPAQMPPHSATPDSWVLPKGYQLSNWVVDGT